MRPLTTTSGKILLAKTTKWPTRHPLGPSHSQLCGLKNDRGKNGGDRHKSSAGYGAHRHASDYKCVEWRGPIRGRFMIVSHSAFLATNSDLVNNVRSFPSFSFHRHVSLRTPPFFIFYFLTVPSVVNCIFLKNIWLEFSFFSWREK